MGYYTSTKSRGIKYLSTNERKPFCAFSYTISIVVPQDANKTAGEIRVIVKGPNREIVVPVTE
jgi:hypothetical protein